MGIGPITAGGLYINNAPEAEVEKKAVDKTDSKQEEQAKAGENRDVFVRTKQNQTTETPDYRHIKKLSGSQVQAIKDERAESMKRMITEMLGRQATNANLAQGQRPQDSFGPNAWMSKFLGPQDTPETAAKAISKDGEWGVNAVATRLVDMAVSLAGGDASKISQLRGAVEAGFKAAEKVLGGVLPGVCQETYTETMKRFDYWEQNGSLDGYVMQQ